MKSGLLLIKKPSDMTSHQLVARVRRRLGMSEVGHAGTLDPLASGLMVLLLGEATKISDYILAGDKAYRAKVRLGLTTDTLDITGQTLTTSEIKVSESEISEAALALQGSYQWPVPMFSAVKTDGKKLYELARKNMVIETPVKEMKFWDLKVLNVEAGSVEVHLHCSKGSYIRTWAATLGEKLGCGGVIEELERTHSAPFEIAAAISLDDFEKHGDIDLGQAFIHLKDTLVKWPTFTVTGRDEKLLHSGQVSHDLARRLIVQQKEATLSQKTIGIKILSGSNGQILSLLEAQPNRGLKIRRVFKNLVDTP
jgi:tRNA pseudouridine55 synthase